MTDKEKAAWISFKEVVHNFLGNNKSTQYRSIVGCWMNLKLYFLDSLIDHFPIHLGDLSEEQGDRFHQDLKKMEFRYQGRWDINMMADLLTDYSRHLDEIAKQTERLLLGSLQDLLINANTEGGVELLMQWESYLAIDGDTKQTKEEDSNLFLRKIIKLNQIWDKLKLFVSDDDVKILNQLQEKSETLSYSVKTEGSLNAGGKFEWVDSVLIKCLQEGSWLLIDNVNLCSSAVLDRLNALLEPHGVLTVSERGVDQNGLMVEVKPHKNFRLFLTMDPKNGEISRAMRNRGVEIYLLNESESNKLNQFDIKSLINLEGLKATDHINALLKIHDFISDLTLGEKPHVNEILQASSLISQQINHGVETLEVFSSTVIEVYYKTRSAFEFNCNDTVSVIEHEIRKVLTDSLTLIENQEMDLYSENVTLKTQKIETCSSIEKIKQQSAILKKYVPVVNESETSLYNFILNFYSITSVEDLETRHVYLKNSFKDPSLANFIDKLHEVALLLQQTENISLPLDYRWVPETPYKIKNALPSNKLNLALHIASNYFKEELELTINNKGRTPKEVTLLDYMHEKERRKVEDKFNDVIVNEYLRLIEGYDEYLNNIPKLIENITDIDVIKVLSLIFWRFAFHKCTSANIKKITAAEQYNILVNLTMHYKWFYKYAVREILSVTKVDLPKDFKEQVHNINSKLETQFLFMQKLGKNYQKYSNKPPPYINEHQLEVVPTYNEISSCYNLGKMQNDLNKVLNILKEDKDLRPLLVEMKSQLDYDFTDASKELALLKSLHEKCQTADVKEKFSEYELQLLPIIDYLTQLTVKDIMRTIPKFEDSGMATNSMLVPTDFCGTLLCYNKTHDVRLLHEITKSYYLYLMNSACVKPNKYLKGDEADHKEIVLSNFSPKLTFYLGFLLVNANDLNKSGIVKLGNYRELTRQHNHLSLILWRNLHQLSEENYDCLSTEKEYILRIFKIFIVQLAESLNIEDTNDKMLQQIIDNCIQAVKRLKQSSSLTDSTNDTLKFIKHLQRCSVNITKLAHSSDINNRLLLIADLYMELSYLKAILNSKLPLIDPLAKKSLKKEYCLKAIDIFKDIKKCYELQNELYSNADHTIHAYYAPVRQVIIDLEIKNEELGKYVAVRSKDVMYEATLKVVNHAFATILSENYVNKTSSTLTYHILNVINALSRKENIDYRHFVAQLNQQESKISSYENLIHEWNSLRNTFPDIVEPLLSNIVEFLYGLKMKLSLLSKLITEYKNMKLEVDVQEELLNLIKLPALDESQNSYGKHIETITSNKMHSFVNLILENEESYVKDRENYRLLKCGIHESFNYCIIDAKGADKLNKNTFMKFTELVGVFISAWIKQQEDKEIKQREAESLYKTRTKCDDKPEEEQIEEELKELFPNYHGIDFPDLQKNFDSGDDESEKVLPENKYESTISYEDLKFVVQLHMMLVQNYTRTEWLNPSKNKNVSHDFIKPLLEKYKVFKQILDKQFHCLDYTVDTKLISSFNVLLAVAQRHGQTNDLNDQTSPTRTNLLMKKNRDFYKDSDVDEIKSCYHILEELRIKVNDLLDEWPDQPTLKTIVLVIERIYNFDITSPISRFLTGFEILLSKCHEWEEVAHSGVSLSQHYQNITQQIISWRKLELTMWKDLLNQTYERLNEPMAKWWLYIYNIMEQFIVSKQITEKELIETLQTFITKSNLAEFQGRLDLLHVFHCHSTYLDRTRESKLFISILWNLYSYFQQFSVTISNKIKDLKSPIDKKLKDYVKIVKWKDINYWAIKETVDKSHKTLHKYVREFQDVLQQPVFSYLVNTSSSDTEKVGMWDRPQRQNPKTYHYTSDAELYMAKQSLAKKIHFTELGTVEGFMSKVESYFLKSRQFCKKIILATNYPSLVQTLDGFVTEVIETSSHLQGLEVDTNLPKEKQKSHVKNILQQKHRALADLFKNLSKLGLSFRTGIIESKLKDPSADFILKPVDLSANFDYISHSHKVEKMLIIWDSCETYYVRSLMRADVLATALTNPAKDLGLQNIERCKGFTLHLMNLAQKQKSELIDSSRAYYYLRFYAKQLTDSCEGKSFLHIEVLENTRQLLKNITIVMNQCKIILNSCPIEDNFSSEALEVPILKSDVKTRIEYKNDATWSKAMSLISEVLTSTDKLNSFLQKSQGNVPSVEYDLVRPEFVAVSDLNNVETDLIGIYKNLDNLKQIFGSVAINGSLSWLMKEIGLIGEQFEKPYSEEITYSVETFKKEIEKFAKRNLIVVQNMYKKYITVITEEKTKEMSEESTEDKQLQEEHLKSLLVENLSSDISTLEMKKILQTTHKISSVLQKTPPNAAEELKTLVYQCLPLLEQTIQLYRYFITQQVSAYRVICKMNCILLNIFIDLASKGFCIPPEFSDEIDNEGVSKPSDGLGLGEGQGERDVSDKIESEDQLDDAQPAGQEKEKEEDKDHKEEENGIEMSEDFDSKLQDKEKPEGDDEDKSDDDSDGSEQMGETGKGAEQLDQEIWGSDKEEEGDDDEEGSEQKEEKGDKREKEGQDQLSAKEDKPSKDDSEEKDDQIASEEKEKNKKDINELDEPEYDDDQVDPHHGKQPELPEPEPMDLPDDLQLDEGQENENENQEENPFDIDTMKEQTTPEEKPEEGEANKEDEGKNDEEKDFSSDDEEITKKDDDDNEGDEHGKDKEKDMESSKDDGKDVNETSEIEKEDKENEDSVEVDETALDQTQTNQKNVEAMEIDEADAADKTEVNQSENQKSNQPIEELCQEDRPDKEGVGQSQMEESTTGHSAKTSAPQDIKSAKRELEEDQVKKQKPGESDSQRSLGDVNEPVKKKLKTMNPKEQGEPEMEESDKDEVAEMYQHIKDAKDPATQVLDAATKEQAENQMKEVPTKEDEEADKPTESTEDLPSEDESEDVDIVEVPVEKSEKIEKTKDTKKNKKQHPEGDIVEDIQDIDIEGDVIETTTVPRSTESTHHTQYDNIVETTANRLSLEEINDLRSEVEQQLSAWNDPPATIEAEQTWQKITSVTLSLAQDLSEQLRLVLEPTQASRLRGDFRTGRRINMRKVIPYIASQFRKDKIWLRRTKPSKREYQIVLAIDDSSSMADNHSKELAFESVSLISKALTLLESGQLSVISFGEAIQVLHKLTDQFTDKSGVKLLQNFRFDQNKTCVAKLVDFATEMFGQSQMQSSALNAKLLVIVSDGRGVFSEGETYVRQAVRRAKLSNIFMVFVIIDNPENKSSILDIRMPVFKDGKLLGIQNYMDVFPFSFYIILRDINSLPSVLSDALRQWFEIVSNLDKD